MLTLNDVYRGATHHVFSRIQCAPPETTHSVLAGDFD
jgi:hypothetical protein